MSKSKGVVLGEGHHNTIRSGGSGINPQRPKGYETGAQTVRDQFEGSQKGNEQVRAEMAGNNGIGTVYNSDAGNPGDFSRVVPGSDRMSVEPKGKRYNQPADNGNGVVFDGVSDSIGMRAGRGKPMMDSPVPPSAQEPALDAPRTLADLRSGVGEAWGRDDGPKDSLVKNDGVMSK